MRYSGVLPVTAALLLAAGVAAAAGLESMVLFAAVSMLLAVAASLFWGIYGAAGASLWLAAVFAASFVVGPSPWNEPASFIVLGAHIFAHWQWDSPWMPGAESWPSIVTNAALSMRSCSVFPMLSASRI